MIIDMKHGARLLVVNPNTSIAVTESFVAEARSVAPSGTVIDGVTGTFGAAIVSTLAENAVAGHAMLDLLAHHAAFYDAAILAISFDTALSAAQEVSPVPVVGITQSALLEATAGPGKIGLILFGAVSLPLYEELLVGYGLVDRIAAIEIIEVATAAGYLDTTSRDDAVVIAAMKLAGRDDVGAIVICGAAIVGMAHRIQPRVPLPLFDGAAPSVRAALRLIGQSARHVPPRALAGSTGLSPALTRLLAGGAT
jgi:allantoin racemase